MCRESDNWLTAHFMHISVTRLTPHLHEHIKQWTFTCTHQVHVNVQWPKCLTCAWRVRQLAHSCTHQSLGSLPNYRTHQTVGSLHIYMHASNVQWHVCLTCGCKRVEDQTIGSLHIFMHIGHWDHCPIIEHIRQSDNCTFTCTHQTCSDTCVWRVHINVQRVRQIAQYTFSCSHRPLGSLPIYMNTSDIQITARLHAHIRCM